MRSNICLCFRFETVYTKCKVQVCKTSRASQKTLTFSYIKIYVKHCLLWLRFSPSHKALQTMLAETPTNRLCNIWLDDLHDRSSALHTIGTSVAFTLQTNVQNPPAWLHACTQAWNTCTLCLSYAWRQDMITQHLLSLPLYTHNNPPGEHTRAMTLRGTITHTYLLQLVCVTKHNRHVHTREKD